MKTKKIFSLMLAFVMLFSMTTNVFAGPSDKLNSEILGGHTKARPADEKIGRSITLDPRAKGLKDSDKVRIIVELGDKPLIEYATEKNVKLDKLSKTESLKVTESLQDRQAIVKSNIKVKGIDIEYHQSFTNVVNGFSGTTTYKEAKMLEAVQGVENVFIANEYTRPEPEMINSKDLVRAKETWGNLGYNGEGMVAAIIDTGIDPSHKDMVLTNESKAKLTEAKIPDKLPGTYRTPKVPYGYNYMDENLEILDLGPDASEHGMHVAGIVGANGNENNGGIKGIAPEIQLLAMKVFGNNPAMPSTFGDIIIKAIDDSVALGADVINMSLGSTASFVEDNLEQAAVTRAVKNGVLVSISAGNSAYFGYGWDYPYASNPDIGVVGSPGLTAESIQVASANNKLYLYENTVTVTDAVYGSINITGYGKDSWEDRQLDGEHELVAIGGDKYGEPDCYQGIDVTGKIVLVQRGKGIAFVDKTKYAAKEGAAGIIVYNHDDKATFYYDQGGWDIPFMLIGKKDGEELETALASAGGSIKIDVATTDESIDPTSGTLSDFSSWGATPNLDFKPEITAPGGNIYSTAQNDGYQYMSGTSMAAPHVTGGAALVLQRVNKEFPNLSGKAKVEMTKNLIMSTAHPVADAGLYNDYFGLGNYTSPRRQGAGMMDIYAAATTPAVITDKATGLSKVNLKEMGDITTFTLAVTNFSNATVAYAVYGTVTTDLVDEDGYNYTEPQGVYEDGTISDDEPWLGKFPISFTSNGKKIKDLEVKAGETVNFDVAIDLTNAIDWYGNIPLEEIFENGAFIEGFVQLCNINGDANRNDLSIPYMGFYGKWDQASIIDGTVYGNGGTPFYLGSLMAWEDMRSGDLFTLGLREDEPGKEVFEAQNIAFSPNGDGAADNVIPVLSFLRNAKDIEMNILDGNRKNIRSLAMENNVVKNYFDGDSDPIYRVNDLWRWDGKVNNKIVSEGNYFYEIKTKIDYPNTEWQTVTFPVRVDKTAPVIDSVTYDEAKNKLEVVANDGKYSMMMYQLYKGKKLLGLYDENGEFVGDSSYNGIFDTSMLNLEIGSHDVSVVAYDYAWNKDTKVITIQGTKQPGTVPVDPSEPTPIEEPKGAKPGDTTIPTVMLTDPEFMEMYNTSEIVFEGYVEDESSIDIFKINGAPVDLNWDSEDGVWYFAATLDLKDGYHSIRVEAKDSADNEIDFLHKVFVDTTKPVITVTNGDVGYTKAGSIKISAKITDNLPILRVRLNSDMLTNIEPNMEFFESLKPAEYILNHNVALQLGSNTIVIEAEDGAGNAVTKTINITREKPSDGKEDGEGNGGSGGSGGGSGSPSATTPTTPTTPPVQPTEPAPQPVEMTDLQGYEWAKEQINALVTKGILRPAEGANFAPKTNITRADFAYGLIKALGLTALFDSNFDDVNASDYYYNEIAIARALGILTGVGGNKLNPDAAITRQDMMTMIDRALTIAKKNTEGKADLSKFADNAQISGYAQDAIARVVELGIIQGDGTNVNPLSNTSRAEAAVVLFRLLNLDK